MKEEDEKRQNLGQQQNADKFIKEMLSKAKLREEERLAEREQYKYELSLLQAKDNPKNSSGIMTDRGIEKGKSSRSEKSDSKGNPYKTSPYSSQKKIEGLKIIKEAESDSRYSRQSSILVKKESGLGKYGCRRASTKLQRPLSVAREELNFENQDEDIDLLLNTLRNHLDRLYKDRTFLKDLYKVGELCSITPEPLQEGILSKKLEHLKTIADEIYIRFYKTQKYVQLLQTRIQDYKLVKEDAGPNKNQLPTVEPVFASRFEEADQDGNYYDMDDWKIPQPIDKIWADPSFPVEEWAENPPKFKKGFNSRFTRINMKDINPEDKKLDDYFNRKQVIACTSRGVITQPIRHIIEAQVQKLELEEEKRPSSLYCIFDKQGRPASIR